MDGPVPELAAESDHQRVHGAVRDILLLALDAGDDLLTRIDTAGMRGQNVQQIELATRQRQLGSVQACRPRGLVEDEPPERADRSLRRRSWAGR